MKLQILIALLLASTAVAQHPRDFVPDDAMAVVSIKKGDAVNATLKSINNQSGLRPTTPNAIELSEYFENPSAVDLASEVLIIVVPTKLEEGQQPPGMFGSMPHMMLVCKAKEGLTLELSKFGSLKTSTIVDGWFVGTGASKWSPSNSSKPSPILDNLPNAQISAIVSFGSLWKQFGPIAQMMGGMAIGSMNRPGPDGVISPERKKATASAGKGFKELIKWCANVQDISVGVNFDSYTIIAKIDVDMKEGKNPTIDNSSLLEMSKLLSDNMIQYAMSGKLTRKFIDMDLGSLQELTPNADSYPTFMVLQMKAMANSIHDNIVAYGLNTKNGLTITSLSDVENQEKYIEDIFEVVSEVTGMVTNEFNIELSLTNSPATWDISSLSSDEEEKRLMEAIFHDDSQLRFANYGKKRVLMALGPKSWQPLGRSHSTPLSEVMQEYTDTVDIDFAMSFDARTFFVGFTEIVNIADPEENMSVGTTPSAKSSLLFGTTKSGTFIEIKSDLLGTATLIAEIDKEEDKSNSGSGIGKLSGTPIGNNK